MKLSSRSLELLATSRVAHLATSDQYARPHVVPIVFVYDEPHVFTPIDSKPKSVADWRELRRVRNIETNGRASVVVDRYAEDWTALAWVRLDGTAEILTFGEDHGRALKLLERKYEQYRAMPLGTAPVVRLRVEHATEWSAS
ncbi:MAG TPA: TIGR03668 family PPOX class F420-dependent oxidoreductase [Candidatus Limnocylindria bacterium]|jgi:PPOX class probable F420-dependent enzyme|nr:TIGR03668 family PPOX class F420-dependent oxidoreductase [Candidatus Limnocylindria bacterium]